MNDKKFLAQLNLYLDGEIDPAGAAALEHEINVDPARRRVYNDYCRIHRATKLIYEQFRAAGAEQESGVRPDIRPLIAPPAADGSIPEVGREGGGRAAARPFRTATFVGGLAAACTIGIFIGAFALSSAPAEPSAPAPTIAASESTPATPVATTAAVSTAEPAFTAPFATGSRPDPYLVQFPPSRIDPFALTLTAPMDEMELTRLMPASASLGPVLKVDPRFQPATQGFDHRPDSPRQRENRSLRIRLDERATPTPPYEFSVEQ